MNMSVMSYNDCPRYEHTFKVLNILMCLNRKCAINNRSWFTSNLITANDWMLTSSGIPRNLIQLAVVYHII